MKTNLQQKFDDIETGIINYGKEITRLTTERIAIEIRFNRLTHKL
jgi:hypothetical protein